jgi:hypothetical protein
MQRKPRQVAEKNSETNLPRMVLDLSGNGANRSAREMRTIKKTEPEGR